MSDTIALLVAGHRRVNGYDMAFVEQEGGVPVVLVHGSPSGFRPKNSVRHY